MTNTNRSFQAFSSGNQHYKSALNTGRPKLFNTPAELWEAACGYFDYCVDNPIPTYVCRYNKIVTVYKMRAMSMRCLHLYLGISNLKNYSRLPAFEDVMGHIKDVIYTHNFTGAAAGLLKGKIIVRTLRE